YANYNTTIYNGYYMLKNFFIFLTFLGLLPLASQAAIYKWVDEDGSVHYSQQKPQNTQTEKIKVTTRVPENSSTYNKPSLNKKEDPKQATDKATKDANSSDKKPEKSAKERAALCKQSQADLQALTSRGRIRQKDDKGNISYMSEEQKQQRIKREQDRVKENCK
ncbi:MAG: DUF4124 domain-containing protein, partial [Gammaproteobacteria bacterium]|nr:DUF4124 domain-containing protein [Gammaproteobacteria bacterium]